MSPRDVGSGTTRMVIDITQRAGHFLDLAHPGAHKNKRIAQRHRISPEMAKLLRRGEGWTAARLGQAAFIYGRIFVDFVFANAPRDVMPFAGLPSLDEQRASIDSTDRDTSHVDHLLAQTLVAPLARVPTEPKREAAEPESADARGDRAAVGGVAR